MTKEPRRIRDRVADLQEAIEYIKSDVGDLTRAEFLVDGKTQRAVIEGIIVIGEAGKRIIELDPTLQERAPELWQHLHDAYDMRIVLTHEYFRVDPAIVWTTVKISIPALELLVADCLGLFQST